MRLVDIDDIRVMKFPSEEDDPSESDGEREYRNGWNDAITAINDIQPSEEPEIIRCKDCQYLETYSDGVSAFYYCNTTDSDTKLDGYCHRAKRRTDE